MPRAREGTPAGSLLHLHVAPARPTWPNGSEGFQRHSPHHENTGRVGLARPLAARCAKTVPLRARATPHAFQKGHERKAGTSVQNCVAAFPVQPHAINASFLSTASTGSASGPANSRCAPRLDCPPDERSNVDPVETLQFLNTSGRCYVYFSQVIANHVYPDKDLTLFT